MKRLRVLWPYFRRHRRRLLLALAGTCLVTVVGVLPPLLFRHLFDNVLRPGAWHLLIPAIGAIFCVGVVSVLLGFINTWVLMTGAYRFVKDLRIAMYDHILNLALRYHGSLSAGAITTRLMSDVSALQTLVTSSTIQILVDLIILVFSLAVAFTISPKLATILCGILVLYVMVYRRFATPIQTANRAYRRELDRLAGRLQETVHAVRQVRIYNREEFESGIFGHHTARSTEAALDASLSSVGLGTFCTMISGYGSTLIAVLSAAFVLADELTYGDLWAVGNYAWMAINPAVRLATVSAQLAATSVSIDRIVEVLTEPRNIVSGTRIFPTETARGRIEFRDIHFAYGPEKSLFKGFDLTIEAGSTVALVGHTGCGKTSLANLLMRYWDVQGGCILVDDIGIRDLTLRSLRRLFGVVLQDPVLFEGTLAECIAYGIPGASRDRIAEAARLAEILEMATALPDGFDTVIGKHGVQLSKGEKQRVSIARAVLCDPLIMVLDEATSALDSRSEALIQAALSHVLQGRTSLVVAHRLSTITQADKIIVMKQGRLIEQGTFVDLMAKPDGHFRAMHEQFRHGNAEDLS